MVIRYPLCGLLKTLVPRRSRLQRLVRRYIVPPAALTPSYLDYIKQRPLMFAAWFHWRRLKYTIKMRFRLTRSSWRDIEFEDKIANQYLIKHVIPHNKGMMWKISRGRTERLMNILRTIGTVDSKNSKVLCVGPRNESDILLLSTYGFPLKNITAIDLFSYSPLIDIMDMHDLRFNDNQFDIIYCSAAITYSYDIQRVCSEFIRVTKDSGLIAIGYTQPYGDSDLVGAKLSGGLKELFGCFGDDVKHIYWQEEIPLGNGEKASTTIFSISK